MRDACGHSFGLSDVLITQKTQVSNQITNKSLIQRHDQAHDKPVGMAVSQKNGKCYEIIVSAVDSVLMTMDSEVMSD